MAEIWEVLTALLVGFLILDFLKLLWSSRHYPPGPLPLPLIGGLWQVGTRLSRVPFTKLQKQYGDVYTLWLWHKPVVVISGFHAMKESLINHSEDFADRPISTFLLDICKGKGTAFANGHTWKQQRRFSLRALRELGLGKKGMEYKIEEEARRLVEIFAHAKGQPIDPLLSIINSVCNVICLLSFGYCFSHGDTKFQTTVEDISNYMKFGGSHFLMLYEMFPWLMKHLPGPHQKIVASLETGLLLVEEEMEKHKQDLALREPEDFLDLYLLQIKKKQSEPNSTFNHENMAHCILEFLVAGTDTTGGSLQWALLLMVTYPDIQGARVCLGEQLARIEVFLFFTNLVKAFQFQLPEGVKELSQEPVVGLTLHPQPFKLCAIPRCRSS